MIFRRGYRFLAGVAFEQGKFLPTPETVPFRLTRDMVDGMGLTGVEGVYRRCCEKTMEVMRTSQESLMTVVEVRCANKRSVSCMHSHVLDQKEGESIKRSFSEQRRPTPASAWHLTQRASPFSLLARMRACTFVFSLKRAEKSHRGSVIPLTMTSTCKVGSSLFCGEWQIASLTCSNQQTQ